MYDRNGTNPDAEAFCSALQQSHKSVDPCFMTGKGCVYTEVIERAKKERKGQSAHAGFMIMPFRHNLRVFFNNCLTPFFRANYGGENLILSPGDEVPRPGVIICEGICKRIQESDFVIADISLPNPNVFYELGLAFGIGQKIIAIYHDTSTFGKEAADKFKPLGCKAYAYHDLDPIRAEDFAASTFIWNSTSGDSIIDTNRPNILLYEHDAEEPAPTGLRERPQSKAANAHEVDIHNLVDALQAMLHREPRQEQEDISLTFKTQVLSAVGLAINTIYQELQSGSQSLKVIDSYLPIIKGLQNVETAKVDARLIDIRRQVDQSYCLIVKTGAGCHPLAYFWLGYGHARGKNVIPITVVNNRDVPIKDLAFDIRAQRHMTFMREAPERMERELKDTFQQMIQVDFSEWSRKRFWDEMLGRRGEVSIFTGALHNDRFNREMIGDWDLRAVSELTSYLGRHHYRAKIETPIYAPEQAIKDGSQLNDYVQQLIEMIRDKNCILIASPDVNPLTEIVLGRLYSIPDDLLFNAAVDTRRYPGAILSVKYYKPKEAGETATSPPLFQRALYAELKGDEDRRGFRSSLIPEAEILEPFISQTDPSPRSFSVYGHLAIVPNPWVGDANQRRYIVVLNGVSGPATFALTHALTGGVNEEFVSYDADFNREAKSEGILKSILDELEPRRPLPLECIIKVRVGPPRDAQSAVKNLGNTFDWRRILEWDLDNSLQRPIRVRH